MEYIGLLIFIMGTVFGSIITNVIYLRERTYGTLKIDHSNPNKDLYRFEIDEIEKLSAKEKLVLKIDNSANLSQQ